MGKENKQDDKKIEAELLRMFEGDGEEYKKSVVRLKMIIAQAIKEGNSRVAFEGQKELNRILEVRVGGAGGGDIEEIQRGLDEELYEEIDRRLGKYAIGDDMSYPDLIKLVSDKIKRLEREIKKLRPKKRKKKNK